MRKIRQFPRGQCPTCGQRIADMPLTVDVQNNIVIYNDIAIHMAPRQIEIIATLIDVFPNVIPTEKIYTRVWGALCENRSPAEQAVGLQVCLANKLLELLGLKIENVFGNGYRLTCNPLNQPMIHKWQTDLLGQIASPAA